jgi:hypothetical protein
MYTSTAAVSSVVLRHHPHLANSSSFYTINAMKLLSYYQAALINKEGIFGTVINLRYER